MVKRGAAASHPYRIWLEPEVHSGRDLLPGKIRQRIKRIVDGLSIQPRPGTSRALDTVGILLPDAVELRRVRLETWRIIYAINDLEKWVWVLAIRRRPPYAYEDLEEIAGKLAE